MGSITSYTMTKTHYGFQYDIERIPRKSLSSRIWSGCYGVGESYKWSHFNANIWYEHTRDYFDILFCLFENLQLCSTSKLFLIIKLIFHCIHPYLRDQKMSIYSLYIRCIYKGVEKGVWWKLYSPWRAYWRQNQNYINLTPMLITWSVKMSIVELNRTYHYWYINIKLKLMWTFRRYQMSTRAPNLIYRILFVKKVAFLTENLRKRSINRPFM